MPCHSGWCDGVADHLSCSLINKDLPNLFSDGAGYILHPNFTRIPCSYPADAGTQAPGSNGCDSWAAEGEVIGPVCTKDQFWECHYRGNDLKGMLDIQMATTCVARIAGADVSLT